MTKITLEIDGKSLEVPAGSMIIQAADHAGIPIPRFCYHKKLSIAANCRMCLVDVEKVGKPVPACATPVQEGMIVRTCSAKARDAQKAVMEFLLINHPLDCPICDQGGQCELQDIAMSYGKSLSRYDEGKRAVNDDDLGSLIATEMTRCIYCTRCIRFGTEIAGVPELGITGRGEQSQVTTYLEHALTSEVSGNIIDLCPVGALTSKPFRYTSRAWELDCIPTIASHDCVGSNMYAHRYHTQILRVSPKDNEVLNESWLSDRDRFSYCGLYHPDRITQPLIKQAGVWQEVDWQTALEFVTSRTQQLLHEHGAQALGGLASSSSTIEELYLFQKLLRSLGCPNIDHRVHQADKDDPLQMGPVPGISVTLPDFAEQDVIFLIGSYVRHEQPLINHRIHQAAKKGAQIMTLNAIDYDFNYPIAHKIIVAPHEFVTHLKGIAKAILAQQSASKFSEAVEWLAAIQPSSEHLQIAQQLVVSKSTLIVLGAIAQNHPAANLIHNLATLITDLLQANIAVLTEGANTAGAWLAGAVPHQGIGCMTISTPGLAAWQQWQQPLKGYFLLNIDPPLDCANPTRAIDALAQAELVVVLASFLGEAKDYADVILPITPVFETAGTLVNVMGQWQSFSAATSPYGAAKPAWKVFRVLGNLLQLEGFEQTTISEVTEELQDQLSNIHNAQTSVWKPLASVVQDPGEGVYRISDWPMYRGDALVRYAEPLQRSGAALKLAAYISPELALQFNLTAATTHVKVTQNNHTVELPLVIDTRIPNHCVYIPSGYPEVALLAGGFDPIAIERG